MRSRITRTDSAADSKPAAAIKLGYATRSRGLGYLEAGLLPIVQQLSPQELAQVRGLMSEISHIQLETSSDRYKYESTFRSAVVLQLELIKYPALVVCLDQSSLATGVYGKWYRLGAAWGDCARVANGDAAAGPDCWVRFSEACRNLGDTEVAALAPCKLWLRHWSSTADPKQILRKVLAGLPRDLCERAEDFPQMGPAHDFLEFLLLAVELACSENRLPAIEFEDGPSLPCNFVYAGQSFPVSSNKQFCLIEYVWSCKDRTAEYSKLAKPVWRDGNKTISAIMVGAMRKRVNKFFDKNDIPFCVSIKQRADNKSIISIEACDWVEERRLRAKHEQKRKRKGRGRPRRLLKSGSRN